MRVQRGTLLFNRTFDELCMRIQSLNGEHPDWRYRVRRQFGLWQATII